MQLLSSVLFSYPSQGSDAHPALVGMGQFSRYLQYHIHTGKDMVQGAGDVPVKARGMVGTQSGMAGWQGEL